MYVLLVLVLLFLLLEIQPGWFIAGIMKVSGEHNPETHKCHFALANPELIELNRILSKF